MRDSLVIAAPRSAEHRQTPTRTDSRQTDARTDARTDAGMDSRQARTQTDSRRTERQEDNRQARTQVQTPERTTPARAAQQPERTERTERADRAERTDRTDRTERTSQNELSERNQLNARTEGEAIRTADSLAARTADSVAQVEHNRLEARHEATMQWLTQGPLHLNYGDGSTPLYRTTTDAHAVFGTASTLCSARPFARPDTHPFTDNMAFQGAVLLLAVIYITFLYRHLGDAIVFFGRITRTHTLGDRLSEDPGTTGFSRFLNIAGALALLFVGIAAAKACDLFLPPDIAQALPQSLAPAVGLIAILVCLVVVLYQSITIHLAGALLLAHPFFAQLLHLKRVYFVFLALITTPTLLLFALCPPGSGRVWAYLIAAQLIITVVLYLKESLHLFLSKKVSILHWFLYLCSVEIFPVSLLLLAAVR